MSSAFFIDTPIVNQRDIRWAKDFLGESRESFGAYGCLVSCGAMMAGLSNPMTMNNALVKAGQFYGSMLFRPYNFHLAVNSAPIQVEDIGADGQYRTAQFPTSGIARVKDWLKRGMYAILEVNGMKAPRSVDSPREALFLEEVSNNRALPVGYSQHFVLAIGVSGDSDATILIADPWIGQVKPVTIYGRTQPIAICRAILFAPKG